MMLWLRTQSHESLAESPTHRDAQCLHKYNYIARWYASHACAYDYYLYGWRATRLRDGGCLFSLSGVGARAGGKVCGGRSIPSSSLRSDGTTTVVVGFRAGTCTANPPSGLEGKNVPTESPVMDRENFRIPVPVAWSHDIRLKIW